jgi:hypothetical protein
MQKIKSFGKSVKENPLNAKLYLKAKENFS